jgi:hypothetical protein
MVTRRGALALVPAGLFVCSVFSAALLAQGRGAQAPPQVDQKKLSDAQKKEVGVIQGVVDGAITGTATPNDLGLAWVHDDVLKATENRQYVPFTVSIDPAKMTGTTLAIYWRVVSKEQASAMATMAATPAAAGKKDDKKNPPTRMTFSYEDLGVHGARRRVRRVRAGEGAAVRQEGRAGAAHVRRQAGGRRPRFLERRVEHQLDHHGRAD